MHLPKKLSDTESAVFLRNNLPQFMTQSNVKGECNSPAAAVAFRGTVCIHQGQERNVSRLFQSSNPYFSFSAQCSVLLHYILPDSSVAITAEHVQ